MIEIDNVARDMLKWINTQGEKSHYSLAASFNEHYCASMETSIETLRYLMQKNLVRISTDTTNSIVNMIEITHEGRFYEQNLKNEKKNEKKKDNKSHLWELGILFLSSIISMVTSIITTNIKMK